MFCLLSLRLRALIPVRSLLCISIHASLKTRLKINQNRLKIHYRAHFKFPGPVTSSLTDALFTELLATRPYICCFEHC